MAIGPILTPLTCCDSTTETNQEFDKLLCGDNEGYISMLKLNSTNFTYKNTKRDPQNDSRFIFQLRHLIKFFTKRKIHDETVLKV